MFSLFRDNTQRQTPEPEHTTMPSLEHNNDTGSPLLHQDTDDDTFRVEGEEQKACRSAKEEKALYHPPDLLVVQDNVNEELEATYANEKTDNKEKIHEATTRKPQDEEKRMEEEREARTAPQDAADNYELKDSESMDALDELYEKVQATKRKLDQTTLLTRKRAMRVQAWHDREVKTLDEYREAVKEHSASVKVFRREVDEYAVINQQYCERMEKYLQAQGVHLGKSVDDVDTGRTIEELEDCIS